ncbi:cell division protein FtsQ/DivIB [Georgenia sp. Z1491]|uniref:cell division protein FtsQ/DivIB n=1 Tax=Georgenia sp. Z1491 TaxID=3416707 RepID=UPI003CF0CCDA
MRAPRPPRRGEPTPPRRAGSRPQERSRDRGTDARTSAADKGTSDGPAKDGKAKSVEPAKAGKAKSVEPAKDGKAKSAASSGGAPPVHARGGRRGPARPTASLAQRRAEKEHAARRLTVRRIVIGAAALALLLAVAWAVLLSPLTALEDVSVSTTEDSPHVDLAEVAAVADPQVGTPLARVDTGAVDEAVGELPGVADVEVERAWPTGLEIEVTPRVPVARTQVDDGWALLDATGAEVARTDEPDDALPQVDVPDDPDEGRRALTALLSALGEMPTELRSQVASASASAPGTITLTLADEAEVLWGSAEDSALKSEVLLVLLEQSPAQRYDVSVPARPTTG